MGSLLFLFVLAVVFIWLVARSVRAGYGRPLAALAVMCCGLALLLSIDLEPGIARTVIANTLAIATLAVPVVLILRWISRAPGSPR